MSSSHLSKVLKRWNKEEESLALIAHFPRTHLILQTSDTNHPNLWRKLIDPKDLKDQKDNITNIDQRDIMMKSQSIRVRERSTTENPKDTIEMNLPLEADSEEEKEEALEEAEVVIEW